MKKACTPIPGPFIASVNQVIRARQALDAMDEPTSAMWEDLAGKVDDISKGFIAYTKRTRKEGVVVPGVARQAPTLLDEMQKIAQSLRGLEDRFDRMDARVEQFLALYARVNGVLSGVARRSEEEDDGE